MSQIAEQFMLFDEGEWSARFNIAPSQSVPVVRLDPRSGRRELAALTWGLVPRWAKDPSIGHRLINARAESLATKPAFRDALSRRRCLVVADGFYEWKREGRRKQPYFIHRRDDRLFAFAGLWEAWERPEHGPLETCTIVTGEPNELVRPLHDRMPVIVSEQEYDRWLDPRQSPEVLSAILRPYPAELMEAVAVGTLVNSPANDDARCLERQPSLFGDH